MIYFIGNEHGAVKIGYTSNDVEKRLQGLQSTNADQLTLLGCEDGTEIGEGCLHIKFGPFRIRGEWFAATDELLGYILSLPTTNKVDVQNWVAAMLPKGNMADLQQLREQIRMNTLEKANKQALDIIGAAHAKAIRIVSEAEQKYQQIVDLATNCAACDIKELIADSCDPPLFDHHCCKCSQARYTVKEREDGFPWCDSCWVNHAIFDSGRFDAIMVQANDAILGISMK